jgi:hypothetical protein
MYCVVPVNAYAEGTVRDTNLDAGLLCYDTDGNMPGRL